MSRKIAANLLLTWQSKMRHDSERPLLFLGPDLLTIVVDASLQKYRSEIQQVACKAILEDCQQGYM